ncbi:ATP-binding protein [Actinoplanes sp. NPDC051513]|uniref:ATP-binding protein n=1 Tax=Actinoplanes sp. NPDC051513 TaxID=3363908 RepID=UPI0037BAA1F9
MSLETASLPPEAAVAVQHWVLDSIAELRQLRAGLFEALNGEPMPPDGQLDGVPEHMAIVATELATNAIRHGRPPTRVDLRRTEHTFVLDVADQDPGTVPEVAGPRKPGDGGLGLHIVGELAEAVGWYADGTTKHVWAEFRIPPA